MHSLGDMCKALNRSPVEVLRWQKAFELPHREGRGYPDAYLSFLETVVNLRALGVSETALRGLWKLEKKLLQILHADSSGSDLWFLEACGQTSGRTRRLLLTNYDMGMEVTAVAVQYELDFARRAPELFAGRDMGEDALRVFRQCAEETKEIAEQAAGEAPRLHTAADWASRRFRPGKA